MLYSYKLLHGGTFELSSDSMLFRFDRPRTVLGTGEYRGGMGELCGVFNQKLPDKILAVTDLPGGTVAAYFALREKELGFSAASGLLTSARMECYGKWIARAGEITVEAFATGGVESNAARAGEAPLYREDARGFTSLSGTINLFVFLSFALPPGLLTRALITVTEAKSALLAELGVYSTYGLETATGTGTDGVFLVMNDGGPCYHDAGPHSQIGFLLAEAARGAIRRTLKRECYWDASAQCSADKLLNRLSRKTGRRDLSAKFQDLSFTQKEDLLAGLNLWFTVGEHYRWQGITPAAYERFLSWLFVQYPLVRNWVKKL